MKLRCSFCAGTGISDVAYHYTESGDIAEEWIKCENCAGFGTIEVPDSEVMRKEYGF